MVGLLILLGEREWGEGKAVCVSGVCASVCVRVWRRGESRFSLTGATMEELK